MKKILTLSMILALSCSVSLAAGFGDSLKQAVKSDYEATKAQTKEAIKKDIETKAQANKAKQNQEVNKYNAKKAEKLKEIQTKLDGLNKELKEVQKSKTMTNTEKTLKTKALNKQIEFYNKQKAALLK